MLIPLLASVPLGVARGALDEIARQAGEGRTARRGQLVDDPIAMDEFAIADTRLRAARAALREAVTEAHGAPSVTRVSTGTSAPGSSSPHCMQVM